MIAYMIAILIGIVIGLVAGEVTDWILPPEEVVAGIATVTVDDVLAIANEILDDSKRSVSWVTPKN